MMWLIALGLASLLVQAQGTTDQTVISGQVVDASNQPIADAEVSVIPQFPGPPPDGMARRPIVAVTDATGRFTVQDLAAGRYRLSARKAGFAPTTAAPRLVEVVSGAPVAPITLTLQKGGAIVGRVLGANGQPRAGVRVMAMRPTPRLPPRVAGRGAVAPPLPPFIPAGGGEQTNDLGEFRIHSLAPGEYTIQAMPGLMSPMSRRSAAEVMVPTYFPGTADARAALSVTIRAGETSPELTLRMVTAPAHAISGVVVDRTGAPIVNAMVRLEPDSTAGVTPVAMGPGGQTKTGADGTFVLVGVVDGAYRVFAAAPVVLPRQPDRAGINGGFVSGSVSSGATGRGGFTATETINGVTTQYTDRASTRMSVTVNGATVSGLQIVVAAQP